MGGNQGAIEKSKNEIKQILERVRGAIRTRVHPRDQTQLLDDIDRIQESCLNALDPNALGTNVQRSRDSARKVLRNRPVDMVQILNEIDGLDQEIAKLLAVINK
jgi:hypothetical protein